MKKIAIAIFLVSPLMAFAQNPAGDGVRGSTPPGTSRDGGAPSDGAIKGGTILPGENAGMPNKAPTERAENRCNDLSGTLREQCLKQEQNSSTGGRSAPGPAEAVSPRETPPPQNPR